MKKISVVAQYVPGPSFERCLRSCAGSALVEDIVVVNDHPVRLDVPGHILLAADPICSRRTLSMVLDDVKAEHILFLLEPEAVLVEPGALERMLEAAGSTKAGMVYSDYYDEGEKGKKLHPLNDHQSGSVRDDFDFGAAVLFSTAAVNDAVKRYGAISDVRYAGLYDLRLKVSIDNPVHHLAEPLYSVLSTDKATGDDKLFSYVDPRNEAVQKEMEAVFTDHLKRIGAYLPPDDLRQVREKRRTFPVEASVVIPVRNRRGTIADAVRSALSQETIFPFNVIVVDNHSTDGTTALLSSMTGQRPTLKHIVPARTDLGIGGCWNEALYSQFCGRYAVQLDSDDLYIDGYVLQKIVDMLREGRYAMVIGSYTIVNERLEEIPPGIIDHREWTDGNGHNNALRINGLGAPRAFDTDIMRGIGFLNVSYGEDYAAALRICREYRIGRIFESLYLCRRWSGNTDAALSIEAANRNDAFKDTIRTEEILARKAINAGIEGSRGQGVK